MENSHPLSTLNRLPAPDRQDEQVRELGVATLSHLDYDPTDEQMLLIAAVGHFVYYSPERSVMVVGGYAGTGKTSLMGALVKGMESLGMRCVLLAPTGRAAHVAGSYADHRAFTIHRKIYRQSSYGSDTFGPAENRHRRTLFIVDEASMIANASGEGASFGTGHLLDDLVTFVYNGQGCRLLLMGDAAQLPPVGQSESPALSVPQLEGYGLTVYAMSLREIARQARESGILVNATLLRRAMEEPVLTRPRLELDGFDDIATLSSEYLLERLSDCYDRDGMAETMVVTRSNRRALLFNGAIRSRILFREEQLTTDDLLVVAKNNYLWCREHEELDFVANGDMARVQRVWGDVERRYGLTFANVTLELVDHDGVELDAKVVLDSLSSESPALTREQNERLYNEVMAELPGNKAERYKALKSHPYFNALQVKFAYAVTCHKAQGGQWRNVFIDMGGIAAEATETSDFYRWLYTALTRARRQVYLVNWVNDPDATDEA